MNYCKFMQIKTKTTKATWSSNRGGVGRDKFTSDNKISADGKYLSTPVTSAVAKSLKIKKTLKLTISKTPTHTPCWNILTFKT